MSEHGHGDHGGHHEPPSNFFLRYVFSTDHKIIGCQFLFVSLLFVILGGLLALGVRYQLAWPQQHVPYAKILPGTGTLEDVGTGPKMTTPAPEQNVGLWVIGEEVTLAADHTTDDGGVVPKGAKAILTGFPDGIAVTIPAGVTVRYGKQMPVELAEPVSATVAADRVMGDYQYKQQRVRARAGAPVRIETGDGQQREAVLVSMPQRSPVTGKTTASSTIILPTRGMATNVSLDVPSQQIEVTDAAALEGMGLDDATVTSLKAELTAQTEAQAKLKAEAESLLAQAKALHAESTQLAETGDDSAAAAKQAEAEKLAAQASEIENQYKFDPPMVLAPVAARSIDSIAAPGVQYLADKLTPDAYLQLFTMHASIMIFFVIIPMLVGGFGNFLIPLMIGARDMAFPKLNMLSFWISVPAGIIMLISLWTMGGAAGGGWTMYPTLSEYQFSSQLGTTLWIFAVALVGFSSVVGALNYITTTINMRAPGMSMFRMPLTVWSILITSTLALFATPVLTAAMIMLLFDRTLGTTFFTPIATSVSAEGETTVRTTGGQVLLWQHLVRVAAHPAVYFMIRPAMGVTSDILAVFARKPIFGYKPMVFAMVAISGLGFIVWGHHMFQSGMNPVLGTTFMASTIMIAVPSAIKTFNWLGTLWGGNIQFTPAMLYALGFVSMFVIGGLSGIFMASAPVDIHIHDTYFIVAHIHYVLFGGSMMGIFAGIYHWYPKMFGRQMNQKWGVIHFILTIIAFNGTFFLMHVLGVGGHPRRYASIMEYPTLEHLQPMNVVMTIFAMMMGMAQIPFFYNFFVSLPRKVGRGITAFFAIMLITPAVMGLTYWQTFAKLAPQAQNLAGNLAAVGAESEAATAAAESAAYWSALSASVIAGLVVVVIIAAAVWIIWWLGGLLRLPQVLQRLLYIIFLPAFMAPMLLKADFYHWLGMPTLFGAKWTLLLLTAVPGLVYLVIRRPKDQFGYDPGTNPWQANSLEWATSSPPVFVNFETIPTVYRGPYEYSSPVVDDDWLPQAKQLPPGVVEPTGH